MRGAAAAADQDGSRRYGPRFLKMITFPSKASGGARNGRTPKGW